MNSKMTTDSQLSTTEPKNKTTRTGMESQKWRSLGGLSAGRGRGRLGEKVQGLRSIIGRKMLRVVLEMEQRTYMHDPGHDLRWEIARMKSGAGQRGTNWGSYNSIINRIYVNK